MGDRHLNLEGSFARGWGPSRPSHPSRTQK
jgi:hypothetical protein